MKEVLDRLQAEQTDYKTLRPCVWKLTHAEAARQYRAEVRMARADAKDKKRVQRRATRIKYFRLDRAKASRRRYWAGCTVRTRA